MPRWLARVAGGPLAVPLATQLRGASNAKARAELGWAPQATSWRTGFAHWLDRDPAAPPAS